MDSGKRNVIFFCYGTLKRGDCRSNVLDGGRFIGTARTTKGFTLFDCGSFPAMVEAEETIDGEPSSWATGVTGELYEVPESLLDSRLDYIEGVPTLYDRGIVKIASIDLAPDAKDTDAKITEATTYIWQRGIDDLDHLGTTWNARSSRFRF